MKISFFYFLMTPLWMLVNCHIARVSVTPPPSKITTIEGFASLKLSGSQGSGKSKFSFLFHLPHQGRIEAFSFFGKTIYQIIISEEKTFFVLPSKKAYWQGEEGEVIHKFLGFKLNLYEMISLLRGEWDEIAEEGLAPWSLEKDEGNRVISGQRGKLQFEVKEFFANTSLARLLVFQHSLDKGRIKVLNIKFNQSIKGVPFSFSFLKKYKRKNWAEIEKILADES